MSAENFGSALGVGEEVTWRTAVSRNVWMPFIAESLREDPEKGARPTVNESNGGRVARKHFMKAKNVGGNVRVLATYQGQGLFWKHLLGTVATTGPASGLYTHTYTLTASHPAGLTMETVRGNSGKGERFDGCKLSRGVFSVKAGELAELGLDVIAGSSAGRAAAATPSYTTSRDLPIRADEAGQVVWNSTSRYFKGLEITVDNKLARRPLCGTLLTAEPKPSGDRVIKVKLDLEYDDDAFQTALVADTVSDVVVAFTDSAGRSITFTLDNAYVESVSDPISAGNAFIAQSAVLVAQVDNTEGFVVVIVNESSTGIVG